MTMTTTNPYADAFDAYWNAGWRGVLPLPYQAKAHPPSGYTGRNYIEPSYADCASWAADGQSNIALHLPKGVIGLDVDDYGDKGGGSTLAKLVEECGPLPPTWLSTSRGDGISGIRLYRVPEKVELVGGLTGIEVIQYSHRYVVCWPSIHPEGMTYGWFDERKGEASIPTLDDLPMLPDAWIVRLVRSGEAATKADVDDATLAMFFAQLPDGEPCQHIVAACGLAMRDKSRHDAYNDAVLGVLASGRQGCPGAVGALKRLKASFVAQITTGEDKRATVGEAVAEWKRSLIGGVGLIVEQQPEQGAGCPDDYMAELMLAETADQADDSDNGEDGDGDGDKDEAQSVRDLAVARKAAEMALVEDARALLATWRAGQIPPLEGHALSAFLAQPDEPVAYRIDKLWPINGRVLLAAAAKAGKTTMVMNLLHALADGGYFLGCYEVQQVTDGTIVYLNLEVSENQMRRWMRRAGIVNVDKIVVANLRGVISALSLASEQGRKRVVDWLRSLDARVVILDPLAPLLASVGLSEDSNSDVAMFFTWWAETLMQAGVTEDFICHHAGWDGSRSRGASRLVDEPDAVWTISRDSAIDDDGDDIYDGREPRFFKAIGRDVEHPEQLLEYDGATGELSMGSGSRKQMKAKALTTQIETAILEKLQEDNQATQNDLCRRLGFTYQKAKDALDDLVERRLVSRQKVGQGYIYTLWATDTATDTVTDITPGENPCQSPTHTPEGGVGVTDNSAVSVSVSVTKCEDCDNDTGNPRFRICKDCERQRRGGQ